MNFKFRRKLKNREYLLKKYPNLHTVLSIRSSGDFLYVDYFIPMDIDVSTIDCTKYFNDAILATKCLNPFKQYILKIPPNVYKIGKAINGN